MSILQDKVDVVTGRYIKGSVESKKPKVKGQEASAISFYSPKDEEKKVIESILNDFKNGWQTMHLPRPEFNDMSLYQRYIIDVLAFNTYQENDGNSMLEDRLGGWKSNAIRPIIRNKCISIAAHMTARQLVPKIFAYNDASDEQEDAAKVMGYLLDWARDQAKYPYMALHRNIMSLYAPISWGYTEYSQAYRQIKKGKDNKGEWIYESILDEDESGFKHTPVGCDQVFFPNFYERDPQKQDFIIFRRIISYDKFKELYPETLYPNSKYVSGGVIVIMDDANKGFYNVYDNHMRKEEVEEVIRWRKSTDSREVMVNGVLISEAGQINPRGDHQYPWDCHYYLPINERCIAGKSLVFAMQSDSTIVNTLYQLWIDGIILNQIPPVITTGSDKVGADVFVPGLNLAFSEQDVKVTPIKVADGNALAATAAGLQKVESSINESSQDPIQQGQQPMAHGLSTAYEISRIEQNAATVLGLSLKFFANAHVIPFGKLLMNDVLQYLTLTDAEKITENGALVYKTFYINDSSNSSKKNKIRFDLKMPEMMDEEEKMDMAFNLLKESGGLNSNTTLWKVNPVLFRNYKYSQVIDADVLNPRSSELSRAYDLETYDRAIQSPVANQEALFTDLLMSANPKTARDPKRYIKQADPMMASGGGQDAGTGQQANGGSIAKANAPIASQGDLTNKV